MEWQQFVEWSFKGLIGLVLAYGVNVLSKLQESIERLNIKIAVVIDRVEHHEKRLDKLEDNK